LPHRSVTRNMSVTTNTNPNPSTIPVRPSVTGRCRLVWVIFLVVALFDLLEDALEYVVERVIGLFATVQVAPRISFDADIHICLVVVGIVYHRMYTLGLCAFIHNPIRTGCVQRVHRRTLIFMCLVCVHTHGDR